jgi:hypothetical protein
VIAGPGPARETGSVTLRLHPFRWLRRGLVLCVGAPGQPGTDYEQGTDCQPGTDRGAVAVPGRRLRLVPQLERVAEIGVVDVGRRVSWVELLAVRSSRATRYRQLGAAWVSLPEQGSGQREPDVSDGEQGDQRECGAGQ